MVTFAQSRAIREDYLARLDRLETAAVRDMQRQYLAVAKRIEDEIAQVLDNPNLAQRAVAELFTTDPQTAQIAILQGRAEYIREQLLRFSQQQVAALSPLTASVVAVGIKSGEAQLARIAGSFTSPNRRMIENLVATLQPGAAEYEYWTRFAADTTSRALDTLTQGVIMGNHPSKIARDMRDKVVVQGSRLRTAVRTQIMNSARAATGAVYLENADIIPALVWTCVEDANTCAICWAMNGTVMMLGDEIESHPNCRCEALPMLEEDRPDGGFGEQMFDPDDRFQEVLSVDEQIKVLGPSKYALYNEGKVALPDLVRRTTHPTWGNGRAGVSLRELADRGVVPDVPIERVAKRRL